MQPIHNIAVWTLDQLNTAIQLIPEDTYSKVSSVFPGSTIGQHARHICDHFHLLLKDIEHKGTKSMTVDFDARQRNIPMETCRNAAQERILNLRKEVEAHKSLPLETPVKLSACLSPNDISKSIFESSFGRELWYCCIHAVHHFAAIRAICVEAGTTLPKDFGMAPSTLQNRAQAAQALHTFSQAHKNHI